MMNCGGMDPPSPPFVTLLMATTPHNGACARTKTSRYVNPKPYILIPNSNDASQRRSRKDENLQVCLCVAVCGGVQQ